MLLHATEEGVNRLQARFATWLRTLNTPARFVCWQMPATLDDKINAVNRQLRDVDDPQRAALLTGYRRHYEQLQDAAAYQRSLCGVALWSDAPPRALAGGLSAAFDTPVVAGAWPHLFEGRYVLRDAPFWHLAPVGRPGGRPLWAVLTSYEFTPASWNFFRPLPSLLTAQHPAGAGGGHPDHLRAQRGHRRAGKRHSSLSGASGGRERRGLALGAARGGLSPGVERVEQRRRAAHAEHHRGGGGRRPAHAARPDRDGAVRDQSLV